MFSPESTASTEQIMTSCPKPMSLALRSCFVHLSISPVNCFPCRTAASFVHRTLIVQHSHIVQFQYSNKITSLFLVSPRCFPPLTLSLLVSRVRLADNVQVSVVSLAGFSSNDLAMLASLLDRTVNLHSSSLLHRTDT